MGDKMIIYCATNRVNGKRYVGKTEQGLRKRKQRHAADAKNGSDIYFHKAIRKYGVDGFTWDVIYRADNEKDLNRMEINFIRMFKSADREFGYNLTHGGEGCSPNEITRAKMSKAANGRKHSDEARAKMSKAKTGEKNPLYGKKRSGEARAKQSKALTGKKHTDESRAKISEAQKDKTVYTFQHKDHGLFTGMQYELRIKYGLDRGHLSRLIGGKLKSTGGWRMAGDI